MHKITICGAPVRDFRLEAGPSEAERFAAKEFSDYCEKIGGARPEGAAGTIRLAVDTEAVKNPDGFRITVRPGALTVLGGGPRGIAYGAYEVFRRYLGVRFYAPDCEELGEGGDIPEDDFLYTPRFRERSVLFASRRDWSAGDGWKWFVKNQLNAPWNGCLPAWHGAPVRFGYGGKLHTFYAIFGGTMSERQPCLSDPANIRKAIDYVRLHLAEDPTVDALHISQYDNWKGCECERCRRINEEENSAGGTLIRFINAVADAIRDEYPHVFLETFAYQFSRHPPKTAPRENVAIQFCTIEGCFIHPLEEAGCEDNRAMCADLRGWGKLTRRMCIWDYVTNFLSFVTPFPNFDTLRQNMAFFADCGAVDVFEQGTQSDGNTDFGELRTYLIAQLMRDPYITEVEYKKIMDGFLAAYFGAGWRYLRAYIDMVQAERRRGHMHAFQRARDLFDRTWLEEMEDVITGLWDKAETLAGDAVRLDRVRRCRLQWTFYRLMLHPDAEGKKQYIRDLTKYKADWDEGIAVEKLADFDAGAPVESWGR